MTTPRGPRHDVRTDASVPDIPPTTDAMLDPDPITGRADPETARSRSTARDQRTDHRGVPVAGGASPDDPHRTNRHLDGRTNEHSAHSEHPEEKPVDEWVTGDEPMTGPQRSYLATLTREAGEEFPDPEPTKAAASQLIERLQRVTGRIPADRGR